MVSCRKVFETQQQFLPNTAGNNSYIILIQGGAEVTGRDI